MTAIKEDSLKGVRYFLRNFTATAVQEHLRSQIEDTGRFAKAHAEGGRAGALHPRGSFDWTAHR